MKVKRFLTCMVLVLLLVGSVGLLGACGKKDDNNDSDTTTTETPSTATISYIEQTYTGKRNNSGALGAQSSQEGNYESDVVSIKLKDSGDALLVYDLWIYEGTYTASDNNIKITLVEDEDTYKLDMTVSGDNLETATIKDAEDTENALIGTTGIVLSAAEDTLFDNGLYVGIGRYSERYDTYSTDTEGGSYTLKISDDEIYVCDNTREAYAYQIERIGNNLVYHVNYDRAGEDGETNLFFVEKKGEHSEDFVEAFGDLDYVIYHCELDGGLYKYYDVKATDETTTLKITQNVTLSATKLFKTTDKEYPENDTYTYENVNMQLTLNANGTVSFLITGNEKYNTACSGKWYVIGSGEDQGVLVRLDNDNFFDGYFALGVYVGEGNVTLDDFKSDALSRIETTDTTEYKIGWGSSAQADIESETTWTEEV